MYVEKTDLRRRLDKWYRLKERKINKEAYYFVEEAINRNSYFDFPKQELGPKIVIECIVGTAVHEYGLLINEVFRYWGVNCSRDIGKIILDLVECECLDGEGECVEDFSKAYSLEELSIISTCTYAGDGDWAVDYFVRG